ncbi:MAG: type II secretion system protein, partial [Patescibacteria group bacterium]
MLKKSGFTIIEAVVVITILIVLAAIPITDFVFLQKKSALDNSAQEFIGTIKSAQNKTLASEFSGQYGVYLNTSVSPNQYTLFKGVSYTLREISFDQVNFLPDAIEFYSISLGGGNEIIFDKITGATENQGNISLRVKTDASQNKTVYISNYGVVSLNPAPTSLDENRVKDSRHAVFDYSRIIDLNNENIILTFDNSVVQQIPL